MKSNRNIENDAALIVEKKFNKFLAKHRPKLEIFFKQFKQKIEETKEAKAVFIKYSRGEEVSGAEIALIRKEIIELLKTLGLGALVILPGSIILIPLIIKLGHKVGVDIIPSAFKGKGKDGDEV